MFSSDVAMDAVRREYEKLVESVEVARNAYYVNDAPVLGTPPQTPPGGGTTHRNQHW